MKSIIKSIKPGNFKENFTLELDSSNSAGQLKLLDHIPQKTVKQNKLFVADLGECI